MISVTLGNPGDTFSNSRETILRFKIKITSPLLLSKEYKWQWYLFICFCAGTDRNGKGWYEFLHLDSWVSLDKYIMGGWKAFDEQVYKGFNTQQTKPPKWWNPSHVLPSLLGPKTISGSAIALLKDVFRVAGVSFAWRETAYLPPDPWRVNTSSG